MKLVLSPILASIFLFAWVSIAIRYWLLAQRDRGVSFVGRASIGVKGVGTWPEPLELPYALIALLAAGYGGWMPHER
jgi:hypothetical protein